MKLAGVVLTHPLLWPGGCIFYRAIGKERAEQRLRNGCMQEECCISIEEDSRGVVIAFAEIEGERAQIAAPLVIVLAPDRIVGRVMKGENQ